MHRIAVVLFSIVPLLQGQASGAITGLIVDQNANPLFSVEITLVDEGTQRKLETRSDEQGKYRVSGLAPGSYEVTASKDGFKSTTILVTVGYGAELVQLGNITQQLSEPR